MSQVNPYAFNHGAVAFAEESVRAAFIRRTYMHLTGAVLALIALETVLFSLVPAQAMQSLITTMTSGYGWLIVLGLFMGVSWMARSWAESGRSTSVQYLGLGLYVAAEAVILLPMLYICIKVMGEPQLPIMAAMITVLVFAGLTAFVFVTGTDLSGMGKYLAVGGLVAMGAIFAGIVMGFSLGIWFSAAMVALAAGYILYDTSNILHHYDTRQHVAASLALFASVVLLFWYVLRILMSFSSDD